ncbi:MAG: stalk domain-containing protein [Eubacteriales bacterium]
MRIKNFFSMLLVLVLAIGVFAGCAKEELDFYQMANDIETIKNEKPVQYEGEIELQLDVLPQGLTQDDMLSDVLEFVENNSLIYVTKSDVPNGQLETSISFKNQETGEETPLMTVLQSEGDLFIKLDDYINFIETIMINTAPEDEVEEIVAVFSSMVGDVEYLSVSEEELISFYKDMIISSAPNGDEDYINEFMDMFEVSIAQNFDEEYLQETNELNDKFVDEVLKEVFGDLSLDIIEQEGNKHTLKIDSENLIDTIIEILDYSLDNSEELGNAFNEYIMSLSNQQYSMLVGAYAVDTNKEMLTEEIDMLVEEIAINKELYKESLEQIEIMYSFMLQQLIEGSEINMSYGKDDDGTYTSDFLAEIVIKGQNTQETMFDGLLSYNETLKEIDSFTVETPTENVTSFTEFLKNMPKTMSINPDNKVYSLINAENAIFSEQGNANVFIKDDYSYLPLRKIAESFGEEVGWDNEVRKPYIVRNGERVYVDNFIIEEDSRSYVKIRELEKLDYLIDWDATTRTIIIIKP